MLIVFGPAATPLSAQPSLSSTELLRQGRNAQLAGRWDDAIASFSALLKLEPRNLEVLVALGYSHYKKGAKGDLDTAETFYRQALALDERQGGALYGLGQIAMTRKNWSEAAGLFRDVLRVAPAYEPVRTRHNLALSLVAPARHAEAATIFEEAFAQPVADHYAQLYLDAMNNEQSRANYVRAAKWGEEGTRRYPQDAWLWDKLAWVYKMCRAWAWSKEAYKRAESLVYKDMVPHHRTVLSLPFRGQWRVLQGNGGDVSHRGLGARFAWDFVATTESGRTRAGAGRDNLDYYSFGQEVLAPAQGRIIALQDGVADNEPYHRDASPYSGNYVLIEHAPGELSLLGHLQKGSIEVKVGQQVQRGQRVGRCGNSGNAALPHLHFSFIGLHQGKRVSWPSQFSNYVVLRDGGPDVGERKLVEHGVPEQNSLVQNETSTPQTTP